MRIMSVLRVVIAAGLLTVGLLWATSSATTWPGIGLCVVAIGMATTEVARARRDKRRSDGS